MGFPVADWVGGGPAEGPVSTVVEFDGGRVQSVCAMSSASLSDGVMYPSVLRDRLLRLWVMRAISAAECADRWVP